MARKLYKDRIGEVGYNKSGTKMVIVEYNGANDIIVEFRENVKVHTTYQNFKRGNVKSVYDKSVYGIGFLGHGKYSRIDDIKMYETWHKMFQRCYDKKLHKRQPTYIGCTVSEEWHNFQNFAEWYHENYYEVFGEKICLDKDILFKGNKIYSQETCVFVPEQINTLFTKADKARNNNLPIGVYFHSVNKNYVARCNSLDDTPRHVGVYKTPEEAFQGYKRFKETIIKEVANKYIDEIPLKLYNVLMSYEVDIND